MDPDILGAEDEDEEMMVSIELLTMVVTVASTLVGLAAGFGWVVTRMDTRFANAEQRIDARFASAERRTDARFERVEARFEDLEHRMDVRFEDLEHRMDARFDRVESDVAELKTSMGDVKVAIARLEGPTPRLIVAR